MNETIRQFLNLDWTAKLKEAIKERQQLEDNDFEIIYVATDNYEHFYTAFVITEDEYNLTLQDLVLLHGDPAIRSIVNTLFGCCGQVAFKGGDPYVDVKQIPHDNSIVFEFEAHVPDKERLSRQLEIFLAG